MTRQEKQILKTKGVYVITYSGVNTIGRNSYHIVKDGRILIVDFGVGFPDVSAYGVQYITPDIRFLQKHASKIDGLVLTHAHMDHVGAVPILLSHIKRSIPILGSRFTIEFVKEKLKEMRLKEPPKFVVVDSSKSYRVGSFHVEFAHVTHSIPQSMAVAVNTAFGKVVYTGDFKLDPTPINESPTDVATLQKWAKSGVVLALLDSTNAFEKGRSESETHIMGVLEEIIEQAPGRVIIGMFSSLVSRLMGILEIAKRQNKKVAFTGRSLETNVRIAMRIGYLNVDDDTVIPIKDTYKYDDKQLIIIATGSQGEYAAALTKMARSKHEFIRLRSSDTIILSSSVIPTNVVSVQKLMDLLSFTGATFINSKLMDVHVSGHAYQEEMKDMARLLNAKYYIPVHGYPSFLFQHKRVLEEAGISGKRILVPTEGGVFQLTTKGVKTLKKINVKPQYVLGKEVLDPADTVVQERVQLAFSGVVTVFIGPDKQVVVKQRGVFSKSRWKEEREAIRKHIQNMYETIKQAGDSKVVRRKLMSLTSRWFTKAYKITPVVVVHLVVRGANSTIKKKRKVSNSKKAGTTLQKAERKTSTPSRVSAIL